MKFDIKRIDVTENWKNQQQPVMAMPRPTFKNPDSATPVSRQVGTFWVPETPILEGKPVKWVLTRIGDHVRIPLMPYRVNGVSDSDLIAAGVELGARAVTNLMLSKNFKPQHAADWEITIVQGLNAVKVNDDSNPGWRHAVGLAIRTE